MERAAFAPFAETLKGLLAETWQRESFDFLVNNAGFGAQTLLGSTDEEVFDQMVDVHFKGVYFLTQALLPLIADGGRIVNTSTGLARFVIPGCSVYAAAKSAVETLTRYWAQELGARGITVNTIAPGATATDFGGGGIRDNAEVRESLASQVALGRVGRPEDIGAVTAALLGNGTGWINGERVEASGGMRL